MTIETPVSFSPQNELTRDRLEFIKSQKGNRYLSKNNSYLVHLKAIDSNIGNLHPMRLGKILMKDFPAIVNIEKIRNKLYCYKL